MFERYRAGQQLTDAVIKRLWPFAVEVTVNLPKQGGWTSAMHQLIETSELFMRALANRVETEDLGNGKYRHTLR